MPGTSARQKQMGQNRRLNHRLAALMVFETATLAVMSTLHLTGALRDGSKPFSAPSAGVAEAIIGAVLLAGAVAVFRDQPTARNVALAATVFAIAGFIVGLTFTISGGGGIDIGYHSVMLPILVFTAARLAMAGPAPVTRNGVVYLPPPWMQRHVGNRLSVRFQPSLLVKLSVQGRRSGRWQTTPIAVLEHGAGRYLVSYRGASDWARNLAVAHTARLARGDHVEEIQVEEVPLAERAELLHAYQQQFGKMPTVAPVLRALPDPADHPMFRIIASQPTNAT
jgi:deazaflavin-dependent oxidoreductase (nitroreductase family)